jgi:hypothetical protein
MSKPKNMTPEQEAAWKEKVAAKEKAYREVNREKRAAVKKTYREVNREKELARNKAWKKANREKVHANARDHYEANRENEAAKRKAKVKTLKPAYVAATLRMKVSEVPPDLLELQREQIRLIRLTRELKKESQNV